MSIKLILTAISIVLFSCQSQEQPRTLYHSCPKPGHGPCYLCDSPTTQVALNIKIDYN